jgi:hypothetical protein
MQVLPAPTSVHQLTLEWLNEILGPQGKAVEIETFPLGIGQGFLGSIYRIKITYENSNATNSIVVKFPPDDECPLQFVRNFNLLKREAAFYNEIVPKLPNKLLPLPSCYYAFVSEGMNIHID